MSPLYWRDHLSTRPNISESHSEISTRVPFCIVVRVGTVFSCKAWTMRGTDCAAKGCECFLHETLDGYRIDHSQAGLISGVVFDRLPPFGNCSGQRNHSKS